MECRGCRSPQPLAGLPGMIQAGAHSLAENIPFALCEHGQQTCHGPASRRRQVQGFGQGDETRSEEHTTELQSPMYPGCRLLLEKKKSIPYDPPRFCTAPITTRRVGRYHSA